MDWLKRKLSKLELPTAGIKSEMQSRLREQMQLQGIDIESYELEDEEQQELQVPATPRGVDMNSLLAAMMEKMQVLRDVQEASRAKNQKLPADIQEAFRAESRKMQEENKKLFETSRAENEKLF